MNTFCQGRPFYDMVPCDYNLTPIHHSEIFISLHDFQVIHPFVDGNGRIGRVILKDMVLYLLNKTITFEYDIADYYAAKSNEKP